MEETLYSKSWYIFICHNIPLTKVCRKFVQNFPQLRIQLTSYSQIIGPKGRILFSLVISSTSIDLQVIDFSL